VHNLPASVVVTLSLSQNEFLTLLSDNIDVAQGLFRMLIDKPDRAAWKRFVQGRIPEGIVQSAGNSLQPVECAVLLQDNPLLARATSEQLLRLAAIARQVSLTPGTTLVQEGDEPAIYIVLSGELALEPSETAPLALRPGDAVGFFETLAGLRADATIRVVRAGTALRIDGRELFDLLSDHVDLLQGLFSALLHAEPAKGFDALEIPVTPEAGEAPLAG
jgi:hypothetical protein